MHRIRSAMVLVALSLAACGGTAATSPAGSAGSQPAVAPTQATNGSSQAKASTSPGLQAVIDGARKEGQLSLSWTAETLGPQEDFHKYAEAFNAMYGLNLKVSFTPGPSMPQMAAKVVDEVKGGRAASSDVVLGEALHIITESSSSALTAVDWGSWAPAIQNPALVGSKGEAVQFELLFPGITYNTDRLKGDSIPKAMEDLLKPQYTGHLASTVYAAHFDELSTPDLWGEAKTTDYVTKFAKQITGLVGCGEIGRVASGEFDALALDCGTSFQQWMAKGAPIGHVIPSDMGLYYPLYMGVPKNAAHPQAAQLWINFILSQEGQGLLYKEVGSDDPLVAGSHTATDLQNMKAANPKAVDGDIAFWQRNNVKQTEEVKAKLLKTLQTK
jgi:ABC-type Fe3+ transport system substrate-binding protein